MARALYVLKWGGVVVCLVTVALWIWSGRYMTMLVWDKIGLQLAQGDLLAWHDMSSESRPIHFRTGRTPTVRFVSHWFPTRAVDSDIKRTMLFVPLWLLVGCAITATCLLWIIHRGFTSQPSELSPSVRTEK
jgi:hypothetical protein